MFLNEQFQPLNEDLKFEALSQLREIQSNLVGISFLPVIAIMKPENPLKKEVLEFQDGLDELTMKIQNFISSAKNDITYDSEEGEEPESEEPEAEEPEAEEPTSDEKEVEDSSEPKDKGDK